NRNRWGRSGWVLGFGVGAALPGCCLRPLRRAIHGPSRGTHAIHGVLYATPRQDVASRPAGQGAGRSFVVPGIADLSPSRVNTPFCRSDVSRDFTAIPGGSEIATYVAPTRSRIPKPKKSGQEVGGGGSAQRRAVDGARAASGQDGPEE